MSGLALLVVCTAIAVGGVLLVVSGVMQPAPSLSRTVAHLQRPGIPTQGGAERWALTGVAHRLAELPRLVPTEPQLRHVDRTIEAHVARLAMAALAGLLAPAAGLTLVQRAGLLGPTWTLPVLAALAGGVLGPVLVHTATVEHSQRIVTDLRYQASAYLDVVTMLLAGNTGYEGALEQAAHAGDGRLFVELRRRMRESGARGASLTDALRRTGIELGLDELEQVAATAALSASEGAPVARTLAAKCATLRSALATEQESEARLRTSRLTTPIVGMALIFMGLVIYPALSFS
ncbi:MAG TPA: type II secretion system F family protein [Acidimicrobiia bacterium]|nr:type II secretion system F family protein [Acidimicrobiia bacterium]